MKYGLSVIACLVVFLSCSNKSCEQKEAYIQSKAQLDFIVENYYDDLVLSRNFIYSIVFLEKLSGIKSQVAFGDISMYNKNEDFDVDVRNWGEWISKNKCLIEISRVKSIKAELVKSNTFLGINK